MLVLVGGLASLLTAMPHLWEGVRLAGAVGLLWLASGYLKPGGGHPAVSQDMPRDGNAVTQGLALGIFYVGLNTLCDPAIVLGAERFAGLLKRRPSLVVVQQRAVGMAMALVALMLGLDAVTS
ncbi:hypothetical protein [Falsiroseomonas sp. HW251]|uniref:hypothetical protein n=1 Tax=Falsiroseomonas sp. HW251 TaxID=3390998 RepID=UPI003D31162D